MTVLISTEAAVATSVPSYPGDNHNSSANFGVAMQHTMAFFDNCVKGNGG